jgi:hypothetical protein
MATAYETIYNRALAKIQDFELAALPEFDLEEMLHGWMISAISKFRKCKSDLKDRDEENKTFNIDLEDEEIEILAIMIVREHLSPQLHSTLLTQQIFSGKEQNYYSQAAHMRELLEMDNNLRLEAQKLMRDYTYQNDLRGYFES